MKPENKEKTSIKKSSDRAVLALVIFLVLFTVSLVAFIFVYKANKPFTSSSKNKTEYRTVTPSTNTSDKDYIPLTEDKTTPSEVNNAAVGELDTLMKNVDNNSNEQLNDLSL